MKSTMIWALVLLNAVLAGSLVARWAEPKAQAAQARPGDYLTIPATVNGATAGIVFVVDTTNSKMSAIVYDDNKKKIDGLPPIDLQAIFDAAGRSGGGGR